jgi:hypothetical protein
MKVIPVLLGIVAATGCVSSSGGGPDDPDTETRVITSSAVLHRGAQLVAVVSYLQAQRSLGGEDMVLAVEMTAARGRGPIVLKRSDIHLRTPAGSHLPLISQKEYRKLQPGIRVPVERALLTLPLLDRYEPNRQACGSWFLVDPTQSVALDEIALSSFQQCSGPLIFHVPGGIQPGRWRLEIELEESFSHIPFELQ